MDLEELIKMGIGKWVELVLENKMKDESLSLRGILNAATDEGLTINGTPYSYRVWMLTYFLL